VTRRHIRTDRCLRLDPAHLDEQIDSDRRSGLRPWIVVASAGTVNTGSIDPLRDVARLARENALWLHVDAAYGGFFSLVPEARPLLGGLEAADSIVLDPHKGLFQPYGLGAVLVADGEALRRAFCQRADYLAAPSPDAGRSPADYSGELTRHFRGLRLWLSLQVHGTRRREAALEEKLLLAQLAYRELSCIEELEIFMEPPLSILAFRRRGDEDDALTEGLLRAGHPGSCRRALPRGGAGSREEERERERVAVGGRHTPTVIEIGTATWHPRSIARDRVRAPSAPSARRPRRRS
jgi:glutamate/tyrosine decarboxylase-like PLP-dependent enzyme